MGIRNSAKALIFDKSGGRILLNKSKNSLGGIWEEFPDGEIYYDLPGGGQNQFETLEEAVKRECLEELGVTIEVERLAAIYEEIEMNEDFRRQFEPYAHKIFFVFICRAKDESLKTATELDWDMIGSEWIEIEKIKNILFYPGIIKSNLDLILKTQDALFLGSERINAK